MYGMHAIKPAKSRQSYLLLFGEALCYEQVEGCVYYTTEVNAIALLVSHTAFNGYEAV